MPISTAQQMLASPSVLTRLRVEVQKDDTTWLDLTDRFNHDRLVSMPELSLREERGLGVFDVQLGQVILDNSDGFWDDVPPPIGISSWGRRNLRVTLITPGGNQQLGVWTIKGLRTSTKSGQCTMTLASLSTKLADKQADRVRDGQDWYTNKPISWLVQQLLMQELKRGDVQTLVASGKILNRYQIPLATIGQLALSHYGRPPEFDGNVWRDDGSSMYGGPMLYIDDASSADNGSVLFGIEGNVWRWNPTTDVWTLLGGFSGAQANFKVQHLFWCPVFHYYIGVGWEIDRPTTGSNRHFSGAKGGTVKWFYGLGPTSTNWTMATGEPANTWTGHYALRSGGFASSQGSFVGRGTLGDANSFGFNLPIAFSQWQRWRINSGDTFFHFAAFNSTAIDGIPVNNDDDTTKFWGLEVPGYMSWYPGGFPADGRPADYSISFGQSMGAFAQTQHVAGLLGKQIIFFTVRWDSASKTYRWTSWFAIAGGSGGLTFASAVQETVLDTTTSQYQQPYALICDPAADYVYVLGAALGERQWSGGSPQADDVVGMIYKYPYDITGLHASTRVWDSPSATSVGMRYNIPMAAAFGASSQWMAVAFWDYTNIAGNSWTAAVLDTSQIITSQVNKKRVTRGMPRGFVNDPVGGRIYWFEEGSNVLVSAPNNSNSTDPRIEDSGVPPVEGDPNLIGGLVYDRQRAMIYGVSGYGSFAQSDAGIMDGPPPAKNFLWQFGASLTDRIELADFSGMNVWEALRDLAVIGDFLYGIDGAGDFFFKVRPKPTSTTVRARSKMPLYDGTVALDSIDKDWGLSEIFNVAEITPSRAVLGDPKGTARITPRPAGFGRDPWDGDIQVYQQNVRAQNIYLRCVKGGLTGSPDDGVMAADAAGNTCVDYSPSAGQRIHLLRYAFLLYDRVVETQLTQATLITDTSIKVPSDATPDIHVDASGATVQRGDAVRINDLVERTITTITVDPATGTSTLGLDSALGGPPFPVGAKVVIRSYGNNRWSDGTSGVTELSVAFGTGGISAGTLDTITARDARHLTTGMVIQVESSLGIEICRVVKLIDVTAGTVQVRRAIAGTSPLAHASGSLVKAFWAPIQNSQFPAGTLFPIGGTGVSLRVNLPAVEKPFAVGDSIEVICPGLTLEQQELSKAISYNGNSINVFGKMPWPEVRPSRFLTFRQAVECARRIVSDYGFPHFLLSCQGPLAHMPQAGEGWLVEDPILLPNPAPVTATSPNGDQPPVLPDTTTGIGCVPRSFSYDAGRDTLKVDLRAVNAHTAY